MSKESIRKHIQALLQERYGDLSYWSDFDRNEFQGDAMRAAMDDMKNDGMNVEPLGKSRYEQDMDIDNMISDLERAKLGLPNESKKYKALQKQIDHLSRMGAGSLNEKNNLTEFFDPDEIKEHDVVYLLGPVDNFKAGDRGTVVHEYPGDDVVEVEFTDKQGNTLGLATVHKDNLSKNVQQDLDEYMSPDAFSTKEYGQTLPDKQIDLYYNRIADDLASGKDTKDIVRTLIRLNGGKLPPTIQTLFDNAQNMYENEEINPDAVDTTNLYKFLKDAIHQMVSKGFSEEKIAQTLEIILQKHFNIQKKNAVFSVNEFKTLDEVFTGTDYEFYADDVEPFLDKGLKYSYNDFAKAFAKTNNAVLHSRDMNNIVDVLKNRGYNIEQYVGESNAISTLIKKGTNAKPNGPAHTILSQEAKSPWSKGEGPRVKKPNSIPKEPSNKTNEKEPIKTRSGASFGRHGDNVYEGNGVSKVIEKGTNVKPTRK